MERCEHCGALQPKSEMVTVCDADSGYSIRACRDYDACVARAADRVESGEWPA